MPLDDAMRLVGQNFDQYMQDLRERAKSSSIQESTKTKTTAPKEEEKSDITALLSKAASGADLSADQLTKLIDNLSKRQEQVLGSTPATTNGKGGNNATCFFCCQRDFGAKQCLTNSFSDLRYFVYVLRRFGLEW